MRKIFLSLVPVLALLVLSPRAQAGSSIKSDEEVVFFITAAHQEGNTWVAPIHGWIFEPEEDSLWRGALVESMRSALDVKRSQEAMFRKRLKWFLVDNEGGKKITVSAGGVKSKLGKSKSNGHFKGTLRIPGHASRDSVTVTAKTRKSDARRFAGKVLLVPETGISVISDIDDTIKITDARDTRRTLERTFLESFQPVAGMASVYRQWQRQGAVFHYVSASPWHLFVPLSSFMRRLAFPVGTLHLKNFRLKDKSRFNLLKSPRAHKLKVIEDLLGRFPKRSFVLVGDSGQEDPEIYADIARAHPGQIRAIYIRSVEDGTMSKERVARIERELAIPFKVFVEPTGLRL